MLDRYKKEVFLLGIASARKELVITLKGILAIVCTVVEDLTFSLIQLVACIYL